MQKQAILLLLALFAIAYTQAPKPVPLPVFNASKVVGKWNVVWQYDSQYNNSIPNGISCWTWTVSASGNNVTVVENLQMSGETFTETFNFSPVNSVGSLWENESDGSEVAWLAVDPIATSYATVASYSNQAALILSKTGTLSNTILNAQVTLLKGEQYVVNSTNFYNINTNNC